MRPVNETPPAFYSYSGTVRKAFRATSEFFQFLAALPAGGPDLRVRRTYLGVSWAKEGPLPPAR